MHRGNIFQVNSVYELKLNKVLLNKETSEMLIANWNGGNFPKHQYIKAQVINKLANMIFVCGVYLDDDKKEPINEFFNGWLPDDQVEIMKEVK